MTRLLYITFAVCFLIACQQQASEKSAPRSGAKTKDASTIKKCLNIVNGKKTADFPSVYVILITNSEGDIAGKCTGTMLSDNTMITASHCLPETGDIYLASRSQKFEIPKYGDDRTTLLKKLPKAKKKIAMNKSLARREGSSDALTPEQARTDVAVLLFDKGSAEDFSTLATKTRPAATSITITGYGRTEVAESSEPDENSLLMYKRTGTNKLAGKSEKSAVSSLPDDLYLILGYSETASNANGRAVAAQGDSGGPMFDGNVLIGIASAAFVKSDADEKSAGMNLHVDVTSPKVKKFLESTKKSGASFSFEENDDGKADDKAPDDLEDPC